MHPEQMRELISEATADTIMLVIAFASPVVGMIGGLVWGLLRKRLWWGFCNGLLLGMLGVLNYGLWRFHKYRMRFDPVSGYAGLHRVDVLIENLLVFIAIGILIGFIAGLYVKHFGKHWSETQNTQGGV